MSAGTTSIGLHLGDDSQPSVGEPLDSDGLFISVRLDDITILYGRSPVVLRRYAAALTEAADRLAAAQTVDSAKAVQP